MPKFTAARVFEIRGHLRTFEMLSFSMAAFAREIGVTPLTNRNWRRRFRSGPGGQHSAGVERRVCAEFIEVQHVASSPPMTSPAEIAIADIVIRVSAGADDTTMRAVLRAARSC